MARHARPTLRCLREDLGQAVPPADTPLGPHRLLAKADERFADDGTPRERIAAIDDQVLFKEKVCDGSDRRSPVTVTRGSGVRREQHAMRIQRCSAPRPDAAASGPSVVMACCPRAFGTVSR
jgi:hypothetical protein